MNLQSFFFTTVFCLATFGSLSQSVNIIPYPKHVEKKQGNFLIDNMTKVFFNNASLGSMANYTATSIADWTKKKVVSTGIKKPLFNSINFLLDTSVNANKESYSIQVTTKEITIKSSNAQGLFYGVQSLLQMIPVSGAPQIPAVSITDEPRFGWRGLMLDVSRHFFTISEVKRMIDQMAAYKFNILHIHLTDDQGWRIEIKSLPELTTKGALRVPRTGLWWDREPPKEGEQATYGGFYTQEEIKDLIKYAGEKYIQILPEIDVPGHSLAAIATYPYLSSTQLNYKVNPGSKFYGIDDNSLCAGRESTFEFLDKVFTEVSQLFPFEYIHIGGDECYKGFWSKCADCQKRIKDNGLKDVNELQSYFIKRLEKILQQKGKKLMGWDEILEGGLAPNASVMSWRGMDGGIAAAKANHHVVMSPSQYAYLDLYQGDPAIEPPTYSKLRLNYSYSFEPVPADVDPSFILGGQGNLWTESVPTFRHAEYMLWPRAFALAETFWSPASQKNWPQFIQRTEARLLRLKKEDINFSSSFLDAIILPSKNEAGQLQIELDTEIEGMNLFYTFDNTYPDHHSKLYKKGEKLMIPADAETFRVVTYRNNEAAGRIITVTLQDLLKRVK